MISGRIVLPKSKNPEVAHFSPLSGGHFIFTKFLGVFMRRNTKIAGIALALLGAAFLLLSGFASCNADDGDDEKEAEIESVSISADAECIGAEGSTTLTAKPSFSKSVDSPSVSYSWENTGGGTLSDSTSDTATLTGKNESGEDVKVTVTVKVTYNGKSVSASCTVTILADGTVLPTGISLSSTTLSLEITDDEANPTSTLKATLASDGEITSGYDTITWTSSNTSVATVSDGVVTAVKAGSATITAATVNGYSATCAVTVTSTVATNVIKASDLPDGWAGINGDSSFGGYGASSSNIYTVSDYSSFINALKCGGKKYSDTKKIIYVSDEIDLNGGKTPYDYITDAGKGGTYSSYEDWKSKFLATCIKNTASTLASYQSAFHKQQKNQSNIMIPSNTTIIGIADNAGFKNGTLYLKGVSNIVLRNLTVWDSLDYFPPWYQNSENNFNADMDCITVEGSTYVWIDHCTLGDTAHVYDTVSTPAGELDWVNYDALCDITKGSNYVTVSNCQFLNDDKVGLVGSTDTGTTYGDTDKLKVTFHHNYYNNVGQRLPRVRFGQVHVYNNNYDNVSSCCVVVGKSAQIYVENNYFSANAGKAFDVKDKTAGVTSVGNKFVTIKNTTATGIDANWIPSSVSGYAYSVDDVANVPTLVNANTVGAGVWTVSK